MVDSGSGLFSIIITEKGGTERRESYDRTEINVGRVQGNDLMLPKGNVSKRHARLLFRDGRFIVTDLKSTNGTYVNGRKIAQATIVREGDKIYIGDFVLRIEAQAGAAAGPSPSQDALPAGSDPVVSAAGPQSGQQQPGQQPGQQPSSLSPAAQGSGQHSIDSHAVGSPRISVPGGGSPSGPAPSGGVPGSTGAVPGSGPDGVSYFPLDRDPDEGAYGSVPSPPRVPSAAGVGAARPSAPPVVRPSPVQATSLGTGAPPPGGPPASTLGQTPQAPAMVAPASAPVSPPGMSPPGMSPAGMGSGLVAPVPTPRIEPASGDSRPSSPALAPSSQPAALSGIPTAMPGSFASAVPPPNAAAFPPVPPSAQRRSPSSEDRPHTADAARGAIRRQLVTALVERVEAKVDLRSIARGELVTPVVSGNVDRALREAAAALGPDAPPAAELELAIADARREILELGPLAALLDDEDVSEVQIVRHDHVVASAGRRTVVVDLAFANEASLQRVLARLCVRAGKPLESGEVYIDRRLDRGRLFAVVGQRDGAGTMVTLRKPQRADQTLDDLVRAGAVSRVVASFLGQAVAARANLLITGAVGSGATTLLGALAAAGSTEDRVVVLQEDDEIVFNQPHTVSILLGDTAEHGARAVRAAVRARPDRLVIGAFAGHIVTEVVDAVGDGIEGVMAAARAPTLRHLAARLPADIAATRGGIALDVAREWLAASFDLVVEVAKLRDGRVRVLRVAELVHEPRQEGGQLVVKDVFAFVVERMAAGGTVEGSFVATGHVPRVAEDLAQRGAALDPALFKPTSKNPAR